MKRKRALTDLALLRYLGRHPDVEVDRISFAFGSTPFTVFPRLEALENDGLVGSRLEFGSGPPRRVFYLTDEGRSAAGIVEARSANGT